MYHGNQQQQKSNTSQQQSQQQQQQQIPANSPADSAAMAAYYSQFQQLLSMFNQQQQQTAQQQQQQSQIRLAQSVTPQPGGFNISSPSLLQQQQQNSYLNLLRMRQPEQQQQQQQRQAQLNSPQQQSTPQTTTTTNSSTRILSMLPTLQYIENQSTEEISRRRPSLMSNFGSATPTSQTDRLSLFYQQQLQQQQQQNSMENLRPLSAATTTTNATQSQQQQHPLHNIQQQLKSQQQQLSHQQQQHQQQQQKQQQKFLSADELEDETTKKNLTEQIEKLEKERTQYESVLKATQKRIEMCGKIISSNQEPAEEDPDQASDLIQDSDENSDNLTCLIDRIYSDNKKRAASSMALFQSLNKYSENDLHQYAPNELEKMQQILPDLIKALRIRNEKRENLLSDSRNNYLEKLQIWEKKVLRCEKAPKRISRDAKHREIFEKTFPEIKKQREERERSNRVEKMRCSLVTGTTTTSNENNYDNENIDAKSCAVAIIPPLATELPRHYFKDQNGLVENALLDAKNRMEYFTNYWTEKEKEMFNKKMEKFGKNFAAISSFLKEKTTKDCIAYYYKTKKRCNYKQKFVRRRKKINRQYKAPIMPEPEEIFAEQNNVAHQNFGKSASYVQCLLCNERINIFVSAHQISKASGYDSLGYNSIDSANTLPNQMAICANCINIANKNKNQHRCPVIGCGGCGKRKIKPVRTVPEKFNSLSTEHKRFMVFKLRLPPSATKCCNNCFKKITKEIDSLLEGKLDEELNIFNKRLTELESNQRNENHATFVTNSESINIISNNNENASDEDSSKLGPDLENPEFNKRIKTLTNDEILTDHLNLTKTELNYEETTNSEMNEKILAKSEIKYEAEDDLLKMDTESLNNEIKTTIEEGEEASTMNSPEIIFSTCSTINPTNPVFGSITQGTPLIRQNSLKNLHEFENSENFQAATIQPTTNSASNLDVAKLAAQTPQQIASLIDSMGYRTLFDLFEVNSENENAIAELTQKMALNPELTQLIEQQYHLTQQQQQQQQSTISSSSNYMGNLSLRENLANFIMANFVDQQKSNESKREENQQIVVGSSVENSIVKRNRINSTINSEKQQQLEAERKSQEQKIQQIISSIAAQTNTPTIPGPIPGNSSTNSSSSSLPKQPADSSGGDIVKRKSGLATAILPSSISTNVSTSSSSITHMNSPTNGAFGTHSSSAASSSSISSPNFMAPLRHSSQSIQHQQQQQQKSMYNLKASISPIIITTQPNTSSSSSISPRNTTTPKPFGACSSPLLLSTGLSSPTSSSIHSPTISIRLPSPRIPQQQQQQQLDSKTLNQGMGNYNTTMGNHNLNSTNLKQLDLSNVKDEIKFDLSFNSCCSSSTSAGAIVQEEISRSTSVKAESCYENLSSESDFEEDEILIKTSPKQQIPNLEAIPTAETSMPETQLYSFLSLPTIDNTTTVFPSSGASSRSSGTPILNVLPEKLQQQMKPISTTPACNGTTISTTTTINSTNNCIYEPLSDDEDN